MSSCSLLVVFKIIVEGYTFQLILTFQHSDLSDSDFNILLWSLIYSRNIMTLLTNTLNLLSIIECCVCVCL